jgi:hypothetical protein
VKRLVSAGGCPVVGAAWSNQDGVDAVDQDCDVDGASAGANGVTGVLPDQPA